MDETPNHWRETAAGCLAIILLLTATVIVGRCSEPVAAEIEYPTPQTEPVEWSGYDITDNAGRALAELDAYLQTVTITTTPARSATAPQADPAAPTSSGDRWDQLAQCETGGNWAANTGNGFGGGLQFMHGNGYSTWLSFGGDAYAPNPWDASREQQINIAEKVLASSGWRAWPGCSRKFGWL